MTKTIIITGYLASLLMVGVVVGVTAVHASEVTGNLSSDFSSNSPTSGNISGTVSGGTSGGGGGGTSGGGGSSNSSPNGSVLGASTDNVSAPSFPNAGVDPRENTSESTLVSKTIATLKTWISKIISF